jgi:uncharacterized protein YcgI (DUF1989 family)
MTDTGLSTSEPTPILDVVVPPREYLWFSVDVGQRFRIVDVEGQQVAHQVLFNRDNPSEVFSAHNTRVLEQRWRLTTGNSLYSDEANPMATIVADTTTEGHFSGGGYCSEAINRRRYGIAGTRGCLENLARAAEPIGVSKKHMPGAFVAFMNYVLFEDGHAELRPPTSRPGDYIEFRADMNLYVALSNCPQDRNAANGFAPTPLRVVVRPAGFENKGDCWPDQPSSNW